VRHAPRAEALPLSAVDPTFHHTCRLTDGERAAYAAEVAFVGTLVPRTLYGERVTALEALQEFNLAIWSIHEVPESLRRFHRGALLGEPMLRALSAAAITVNPHGDFMRHGGNLRLFELCGIGAFRSRTIARAPASGSCPASTWPSTGTRPTSASWSATTSRIPTSGGASPRRDRLTFIVTTPTTSGWRG
jgi:hypothetical protein